MGKPLVVDFFCGLGGWSKGFLVEGYDAVGFDLEVHHYGAARYPGQLVLQDVLTLHGSQFRDAAVIVASPPCQNYSYMAMPWTRAKAMAAKIRADDSGQRLADLNALFNACFRVQLEASEAAGRRIPLVVENVKGAQPWVGPARANFGSFYLWGDVAAVGGRVVRSDVAPLFGEFVRAASRGMKFNPHGTNHRQGSWFGVADSKERGSGQKREGRNFHAFENGLGSSPAFNGGEHETRGVKLAGLAHGTFPPGGLAQGTLDARRRDAAEQIRYSGDAWRENAAAGVKCSGQEPGQEYAMTRGPVDGLKVVGPNARKAASALIAEIPFELANYIARAFKPA